MRILGIIPARYASRRFPGKPLAKILSKSMIQRVYEQCKKCALLSDIIIATDDKKIYDHVISFGGRTIMTKNSHVSGTDRCGEVLDNLNCRYDIVVNIQGDEPYINPKQITELIYELHDNNAQIATLAKEIKEVSIIKDENSPKVKFDKKQNAISFYRKPKYISHQETYFKHIGIYAFKTNVLKNLINLPTSENEKKEKLEQLRWTDNGFKIKVGITKYDTISVDTPNDILKIESQIR